MTQPPLVIFGANGQLGQALLRAAAAKGRAVIGVGRTEGDITNVEAINKVLNRAEPSGIINAAAYTAVDKAESEVERAFAVNRDGVANLARAAKARNLALIHISTDYVFDGTKPAPYVEDDPIAPLGAYGRSKAEGERALFEIYPHAVVLRTAWVYGREGANFIKTMLRLGAERDVVRVVGDQRGCPTYADDLAEAILHVAAQSTEASAHHGLYHVTGAGEAAWYDVARYIFDWTAARGLKTPELERITTADYPTPAKRPANSILNNDKFQRHFGHALPHWQNGLERLLPLLTETP